MKRRRYLLGGVALLVLAACSTNVKKATGYSEPDLGWLFLEKGPYTLETKVQAAPGEATFQLVTDVSLMADAPDVVLETSCEIAPDSTISVALGALEPGFYEVRLRDSVRFNIGIRPDEVVSAPDAPEDFDAFWESTLAQLDEIPLEPVFKEMPEYSNDVRTCYEVTYESFGGAKAGGIISVPRFLGTDFGRYAVRWLTAQAAPDRYTDVSDLDRAIDAIDAFLGKRAERPSRQSTVQP